MKKIKLINIQEKKCYWLLFYSKMNQPYIYIHIYSLHLDAEKNVENKYMDTKGEVGQEVGDWD